jgi:hypothetical protein
LTAWSDPETKQARVEKMCSRIRSQEEQDIDKENLAKGRTMESHEKRKADFRNKLRDQAKVVKIESYIGRKANRTKMYENAFLFSPDGTLYHNIYNLNQFATERNLDAWKIQQVIQGERCSYKGWIRHPI